MIKCLVSAGALAAALLQPAYASAQQMDAAADESAADNRSSDDIIVTAQRREERLQDIPISISAFSADALETAGINNMEDLANITPGLNFARGSWAPQPTIRGIGLRSVNAGDESVVPIFIDGVYQPFFLGGFMELNSLERVEVLKGPQGALFGRNATGGAINLVTTTPTTDFHGKASISYGNYDFFEAKAYVSGGAGPVAADLGVIYYDDNGYIRNVLTGKRTGDRHGLNLRAKVKVDVSEAVGLTLTYSHVELFSAVNANQPINNNTVGRRPGVGGIYGTRPFETAAALTFLDTNQDGISASLKIQGDAFDVHSIVSYQDNSAHAPADSDATSAVALDYDNYYYSKSLYVENYLTSNGNGPFRWIAGMVYFNDLSSFDPVTAYSNNRLSLLATSRQWTDSYALYGEVGYDLTEALTLTASGRYTIEDKEAQFDRLAPTVLPGRRYSDSFSRFTPSATLNYKASPDTLLYLRYAQAFKSGVFNTATASTSAVRPEKATSYEFGIKSDPFPWLRANASIYYTDYADIQVSARDPITNVAIVQNAANASIYGAEGDFTVRPTQGLNLRFGISWTKATYGKFPNAIVFVPTLDANGTPIGGNTSTTADVTGNNLTKIPRLSFVTGGDYSVGFAGGALTLAGNLSYQGKQYWQSLNRLSSPPVWLADASLSWQPDSEKFKVTIWGRNLLDKVYYAQIVVGTAGDTGSHAPPRTGGVRLDVKF